MPKLSGYASSSGGSFRDDADGAESITESIESFGIETPDADALPQPVLPQAEVADAHAPVSHRLRNLRARPMFPDNIPRPAPRAPHRQAPDISVPDDEPREHHRCGHV